MSEKLLLYILYVIVIFVIVTSIMTFTEVPYHVYTPYLYFAMFLFIFDLILVKEPDL